MSTSQTDPRVDEYIRTLPAWQQGIARQVRDLVHAADPDVIETIKRTKQPYFTLDGNICALLGAKDHLNIFIYDPIAPDPEGIINQGQGNLTARAIQVRQGETINHRALLTLFQEVIKNNRAGGWRKVRQQKEDMAAVKLGESELVLSTRFDPETDILVESVPDAVKIIEREGGSIVVGPEEIPVGTVAVVKDPFGNQLTLVDLSKGLYETDEKGNVIGVAKQ